MTIRIGHIEYANCTPIFSTLTRHFDCSCYEFVKGVPYQLNQLLRGGAIDVSPSSSIEYGAAWRNYYLLPELSISSIGPVKSVFLFSRMPIEELAGESIGLTTDSDTSVNLLKIILARRYGFANTFERTALPLTDALRTFAALLLIGDAALKACRNAGGAYHIYDLGELWNEYTGLPFVFALWIVRAETVERQRREVAMLVSDLLAAKELAYASYEEIAAGATEREWLGKSELIDYWRTISYDLTPAHLEGVNLFYFFAVELGLIAEKPELRIFQI